MNCLNVSIRSAVIAGQAYNNDKRLPCRMETGGGGSLCCTAKGKYVISSNFGIHENWKSVSGIIYAIAATIAMSAVVRADVLFVSMFDVFF